MQHVNPASGEPRILRFPREAFDAVRFQQIFEAERARLLQYLTIRLRSKSEAEDVLQMTFLRLYAKQENLHDGNLEALLYVTARNIASDILRHRSRVNYTGDGSPDENIIDDRPGPDRSIFAKKDLDFILKCLNDLSDKCKTSFISYFFEGHEYQEIAIRLGVTESMIRKYVIRATAHCTRRFGELDCGK